MRKADRLSKRYFRVCSWNCASASRRGAVLEKMIYDFDVVCLQETRTRPNRPLVLQGFTVIQRHQGRGMAIVVRSNLCKRVSSVNLDKWSTTSCELQGIRLEKPDERHKSLILINAYIHPTTCITKTSWNFLEEMEDELGDTIMMCGDLNARSSLWDQNGTNQQGCALEDALSDVLFTPVTSANPTHPGTRQGDTDSTIDLALVSPKLAPWTHAETLASHGSDHLPVVFSLQKPGIEPRRKPQYPFKYGKADTGVMLKLRAKKPTHTKNPQRKEVVQPPWWNQETEVAWTDKRKVVKLWQKERSKPHPDLTIKALMEEKTEVFKKVAREAKDKQWKSFCDTLSRDTTLTHFWQFYRQMEGCAANTSSPDLIDANGTILKTSKEKGSALLQRFVHQSNQNNLDERKTIWKGLDRTIIVAGSNDDQITELEFTEALSRLKKDTAPGPDKVKYSDIKNLSEDGKSELFRLYEESFSTGRIPEDWSHSYLKPIPKPGKDHSKLNGYRILTMQNTTGKLMERIVARKLAEDLERKKRASTEPRRVQRRKNYLGKRCQIRIRRVRRIPKEGANSGGGSRSRRCLQQSPVQTSDGTPRAIWDQLNSYKMACCSTPGKKGCHATWKLDLHPPTTNNGTPTRFPSFPRTL